MVSKYDCGINKALMNEDFHRELKLTRLIDSFDKMQPLSYDEWRILFECAISMRRHDDPYVSNKADCAKTSK